jgi:hypothetical protein
MLHLAFGERALLAAACELQEERRCGRQQVSAWFR